MEPVKAATAWGSLAAYHTTDEPQPAESVEEEVNTDGQDASPDAEADGDTVDGRTVE